MFLTVVSMCLFRCLEGYPLVQSLCVSFTGVYCFDDHIVVSITYKVFSSFVFEVVGCACLIRNFFCLVIYFHNVLVITVYFPDVLVVAVYFFDVLVIAVYFFDILVIAGYFFNFLVIAVFPNVFPVAVYFFKIVSSVRCDQVSG